MMVFMNVQMKFSKLPEELERYILGFCSLDERRYFHLFENVSFRKVQSMERRFGRIPRIWDTEDGTTIHICFSQKKYIWQIEDDLRMFLWMDFHQSQGDKMLWRG